MSRRSRLTIGSRSSDLAMWQSNFVKDVLEKSHDHLEVVIKTIETKGDKILDVALSKIGDKGLFTKELEQELLRGGIDVAVHSLKDLETRIPEGLKLAAVTKRHDLEDALIARRPGLSLDDLPVGATVATGALRRISQLRHLRPDIRIVDIRGNVPTRIRKFLNSDWDAMILARAGVERLDMDEYISSYIDVDTMLPAVGQGALGIEIREGNRFAEDMVRSVHHDETSIACAAERFFLQSLQGGCQVPIGAYGRVRPDGLHLSGVVGSIDGRVLYRKTRRGDQREPGKLGQALADDLKNAGAGEILREIYGALDSDRVRLS